MKRDRARELDRAHLRMHGMMSPRGGGTVEASLKSLPGVAAARVSYFSSEAWTIFDPSVTSAAAIAAAVSARRREWPFAWAEVQDDGEPSESKLPELTTPPPAVVAQAKSAVVPHEGSPALGGFVLSWEQAADFVRHNDRTSGLPRGQQEVRQRALGSYVSVCCPPYPAWPD